MSTINRQAAIDAAVKESQADGAYGYMDTKSIVDLLNDLPSAEPEYKELQDWKTDFKGFIDALDIPRDDYHGIMEYIDEVPSAQPEIIRCKDCRYYELTGWAAHECSFLKTAVYGNDFCSWAERRTDE